MAAVFARPLPAARLGRDDDEVGHRVRARSRLGALHRPLGAARQARARASLALERCGDALRDGCARGARLYRRDRRAVRALAERSRDAGLDAAAYLLDIVALEIDTARRPAERVTPPAAGSP